MNKLELFLDKYNNSEINSDILNSYKKFEYIHEELFTIDKDFMLKNLYTIKIVENRRKRMGQSEFRKQILNKYNSKCIITGQTCIAELEAAHLIPVSTIEDYDINNGLLLGSNIHRTFDKYLWSINPNTMQIEVREDIDSGTINAYKNNTILLDICPELYLNLFEHYQIFLDKKN